MATFIVTSQFDDDGGGLTLREAIALTLANGTEADTIEFQADLSGQTIRLLNSGALVISASSGVVTINGDINGDGDADVIVSGDSDNNGNDSGDIGIMLAVQSGATVNLVSMALADGYSYTIGSGSVAGIANAGTLSLTDTSIRNMYAVGKSLSGGNGGYAVAGILNTGNLTVTDSIFEGNQAFGGNGSDGPGSSGGDGYDGYDGGFATAGVFNGATAQLNIQNSGFVANSATQGSGGDGASGAATGGNGGNTGFATTGILNFGTITGQAAERGGILIEGTAGSGGGSENFPGDPGTVSQTGALIINQGTATGFTDLTSSVLIGSGSGVATSGNDVISSVDSILGLTGNDILTGFSGSQTLRGGSGNDFINGNYGTDTVFGGSGNDTVIVSDKAYFDNVHGGTGLDTLDHSGSTYSGSSDILDFNAGSMKFFSSDQFGLIGALTVSGIETFLDSNNGNNIIVSSTGMTVNGNGGNDSITGGAGVDSLDGGSNGTSGDTLRYALSTEGVNVDLSQNIVSGGHATGDTISGFENVEGSNHADTLIESAGQNSLFGGQGADTLVIIGGFADEANEVFDGGSGTDTLAFIGSGIVSHDLSNDILTSIEVLTFEDPGLFQSRAVTIAASQFGAGNIASNAVFNFDTYSDTSETINIGLGGLTSLTLSGLSFTGTTSTASFNITGSSNGDTIIGSSIRDIIVGGDGNDVIRGGAGGDTLNGGSNIVGGDTLDYTGSTNGVIIDLHLNTALGGNATGDVISGFENVKGTNALDIIVGNADVNVLDGAGGVTDTLQYLHSLVGVNVNLKTNVVSGGDAAGDTILNFERVTGSSQADTLRGSLIDNLISGGSGDDFIYGDVGNDTLNGNNGNDTIFGGVGADIINGGGGGDTISFIGSTSAVTINLLTGTGLGGEAEGDTYALIEGVIGSNLGDTVIGSNALTARFEGNGGADSLTGGTGADTFVGGAGGDTIIGLGGIDRANYSSSTAVNINLLTNTHSGGEAAGDSLSGIEEVSGSGQADIIIGNTQQNHLLGQAGADRLDGGAGADTLTGGTGSDSFVFNFGQSGISSTTHDFIADYTKGAVGVGDEIDASVNLLIGGTSAAATSTQASINATTGVATFAAGSGTDLADARTDIATRINVGGTTAGEFAFFEINNTGAVHMFISDNVAGISAGDIMVRLTGVTSLGSISIDAGDVTILT